MWVLQTSWEQAYHAKRTAVCMSMLDLRLVWQAQRYGNFFNDKAYTSQFVALVLIALQLSEDRSSMFHRRNEIINGLNQLPGQIKEVLAMDQHFKSVAIQHLSNSESLLLVGRGYQGATVFEGALKIKEVAYVHSEGVLAGELKHGTLALVDDKMPVIFVMTKDSIYPVQNLFHTIIESSKCIRTNNSERWETHTTVPSG